MNSLVKTLLIFTFAYHFDVISDAKDKELPFPPENQSVETLSYGIEGVHLHKGNLLTLPVRGAFIAQTPFLEKESERTKRFGSILESQRFIMAKGSERGIWNGIAPLSDGKILVMDGRNLEVAIYSDQLEFLAKQSLVWDLIKPPADSRGEPSQVEVSRMRQKFLKAMGQAGEIKVAGLASVSSRLAGGKGHSFFATTRIPGFALVLMNCDQESPGQCLLQRACFVEAGGRINSKNLAGLAISEKDRWLALGDRENHRILFFRYDSCFHIPFVFARRLPKRIKTITTLSIDQSRRLWVGAEKPDDYYNASLYFWEAKDWAP